MRASRTFALPFGLVAFAVAPAAFAATLQVGPGQTYTTPCAAIAAAQASDEIDIAAGTYTDTCSISTAGLHLKGVGGRPKIDVTGETPAQQKGIYAISADGVVIENLELTGAQISSGAGENGAGLRIQSNGVVVTNCYIHDNQNGILAGPVTGNGTGTLTIDHTELANNSLGNGCNDGNGCTHNLYIGPYAHLVFQFNYSHSAGADGGHLFKSRAVENDLLYNRLTGEQGDDSYEVDLPQGGLAILVGNVVEKGPNTQNSGISLIFCDPGDTGCTGTSNALYLANNTFVNSLSSSTTFVEVGTGGTLGAAKDNVFAGPGTPSSTGALSADNLSGVDPLFVAPATYDYHLQATSPAIGKGVAEGSAGAFSLVPVFEYAGTAAGVARLTAKDVGAFEYGTSTTNPSSDAGAESPDGAVSGSSSGSASSSGSGGSSSGSASSSSSSGGGSSSGSSGASSGGDGGSATDGGKGGGGSSGGCGCGVAGAGDGAASVVAMLVGLVVLARKRRMRSRAITDAF